MLNGEAGLKSICPWSLIKSSSIAFLVKKSYLLQGLDRVILYPLAFLGVEDFFASLVKMEREHKISGIKIKPSSPVISHILFTDECCILSRVNPYDVDQIKKYLQIFNETLGLIINQKLFLA